MYVCVLYHQMFCVWPMIRTVLEKKNNLLKFPYRDAGILKSSTHEDILSVTFVPLYQIHRTSSLPATL